MPRTKEFNEEEVLEKATELFWTKGFNATSIQDIVSFTGINRASLYGTYGGKKELFDKSLERYRLYNAQRIRDFFSNYSSVKEGLSKFYENSIADSLCDKKGCFIVNTTTELLPGDDEIQSKLAENKKLFESIFEEYLRKGVESGELDSSKDIHSIAGLLFMLNNGLKVTAKINPDKAQLDMIIASALSVLD